MFCVCNNLGYVLHMYQDWSLAKLVAERTATVVRWLE